MECKIITTYHTEDCNNYILECSCNELEGKHLKVEYFENNGKIEGTYKEYYIDGEIYIECNYIDGKLNGIYKKYYNDGNIFMECNYIDNKWQYYYEM
jgi:antitoxin component YwqK of YwqJK toxin-antitoxin module